MIQSSLSLPEVKSKAGSFFSPNYTLVSQTDTQIVFEDGRDIRFGWMLLGLAFLLIGGLFYYFMAKKHTVTIIIGERDVGTNVEVITNTHQSLTDGSAFLTSL
jgi:hypothetical protein